MTHFWDGSRSPGQKVKPPRTPNSQESHSQLPPSTSVSSTKKNLEPPKQWASATVCPPRRVIHICHQTCSNIGAPVGGVGRCAAFPPPLLLALHVPSLRPTVGTWLRAVVLFVFFFHCQRTLSNHFPRCNAGPLHNLLWSLKPK